MCITVMPTPIKQKEKFIDIFSAMTEYCLRLPQRFQSKYTISEIS